MRVDLSDLSRFLTISQRLSKNSIRHALSRWKLFENWLNGKDPTPRLAEEFLYEKKEECGNNNTVNTYVFSFRMVDSYLIDRSLPGADFSSKLVSLPKHKPMIDVLTFSDQKLLLSQHLQYGKFRGKSCDRLDGLYLCITRFLILTGCRYSEAQLLRIKYVDLINNRVTFVDTKNKEWRNQFIQEPLASELKELIGSRDGEELMFTTMTGGKVPPTLYGEDLRLRAKRAGIKKRVHAHLFRHSYATDLYWNGVGLGEIQQLLGHKDIKTTMGYIHNYQDRLKTAAEHHSLYLSNLDSERSIKFIEKKIDAINFVRFSTISVEKKVSGNDLIIHIRGSPPTKGGNTAAAKH